MSWSIDKDHLTDLYTFQYFKENYDNYIKFHPNAKLIALDFTKFKSINDTYGHAKGDLCLRSFGIILNKLASNGDICVRRSGDEFLILTDKSNEEIGFLLTQVIEIIQAEKEDNRIPVAYSFNAGITKTEHSIEKTLDKADTTMYYAKSKGSLFELFSTEFFDKVKRSEVFVERVNQIIKENKIAFSTRDVFLIDGASANIHDIYSRDPKNNSIFTEEKVGLLSKTPCLRALDYSNLKKIITCVLPVPGNKYIININNQILFDVDGEFEKFIMSLCSLYCSNPTSFIICVNVDSVLDNDWQKIVQKLKLLKRCGFEVALQNYSLLSNSPITNIWLHTDVDYIKISREFWKKSSEDLKSELLLKGILPVFNSTNAHPIFMKVESDKELDYLRSLDLFSLVVGKVNAKEEKVLELKRRISVIPH